MFDEEFVYSECPFKEYSKRSTALKPVLMICQNDSSPAKSEEGQQIEYEYNSGLKEAKYSIKSFP